MGDLTDTSYSPRGASAGTAACATKSVWAPPTLGGTVSGTAYPRALADVGRSVPPIASPLNFPTASVSTLDSPAYSTLGLTEYASTSFPTSTTPACDPVLPTAFVANSVYVPATRRSTSRNSTTARRPSDPDDTVCPLTDTPSLPAPRSTNCVYPCRCCPLTSSDTTSCAQRSPPTPLITGADTATSASAPCPPHDLPSVPRFSTVTAYDPGFANVCAGTRTCSAVQRWKLPDATHPSAPTGVNAFPPIVTVG